MKDSLKQTNGRASIIVHPGYGEQGEVGETEKYKQYRDKLHQFLKTSRGPIFLMIEGGTEKKVEGQLKKLKVDTPVMLIPTLKGDPLPSEPRDMIKDKRGVSKLDLSWTEQGDRWSNLAGELQKMGVTDLLVGGEWAQSITFGEIMDKAAPHYDTPKSWVEIAKDIPYMEDINDLDYHLSIDGKRPIDPFIKQAVERKLRSVDNYSEMGEKLFRQGAYLQNACVAGTLKGLAGAGKEITLRPIKRLIWDEKSKKLTKEEEKTITKTNVSNAVAGFELLLPGGGKRERTVTFYDERSEPTKLPITKESYIKIQTRLRETGGTDAKIHLNPRTLNMDVFKNSEHMDQVFEKWRQDARGTMFDDLKNTNRRIYNVKNAIILPKKHIADLVAPIDLKKVERILHNTLETS